MIYMDGYSVQKCLSSLDAWINQNQSFLIYSSMCKVAPALPQHMVLIPNTAVLAFSLHPGRPDIMEQYLKSLPWLLEGSIQHR
jgi:hypothetical protein